MADIKITDTGKRAVGDLAAQETDIANSGAAIELKSVEITMEQEQMMNIDPAIAKTVSNDSAKMFTWPDIDVTGVDFRKWTIRGVLDSTSLTDMQTYSQLCSLVRTKGYKILAPFSGNPLHAGGGIIAYSNEAGAPLSSINVRIKVFTSNVRSTEGTINYSIELVEDLES